MGDAEFALSEVDKVVLHEGDHVNSLNLAIDQSTTCLIKCYRKLSSVLEMTTNLSPAQQFIKQNSAIKVQADMDPMSAFVDAVESKLQQLLDISPIDFEAKPKVAAEEGALTALDVAILKASRKEIESPRIVASDSNTRVNPRLEDPKTFNFLHALESHGDEQQQQISVANPADALTAGEDVVNRKSTKQLSELMVIKAKKSKTAQRQKDKGKKAKCEDDD